MNKLTKLLRSPYLALCQRWKTVLIPSVIVFLVIYLLQPFGISQVDKEIKFLVLLGYGVVSFAALSIVIYLFPVLFPIYYKEQNWTLGKYLLNILLIIFLIIVGNWLYTSWVYELELNWQLFCVCIIWVTFVAPFPIVIFMMWNRNLQLARNLREATEMNDCLSRKVLSEGESAIDEPQEITSQILIFSGSTKEVLEVDATAFLYAEADGNYIEINYRSAVGDGKILRKILRITMKQAEETIAPFPLIIRCHRAFVVNIQAVIKVDGNSQGYRLQLDGCQSEIPVSRAYAKEVKTLIENK